MADLHRVLAARPVPVEARNLRTSYAALAAALVTDRDCERALAAVDRALAQPGPTPSGAQLYTLRAAALLISPRPDPAELLRSALMSAVDGSTPSVEVITASTRALTESVAGSLRTWLGETWLPAIHALPKSLGLRAPAEVLAAAMHGLAGFGTKACEHLVAGAATDRESTSVGWRSWLDGGGAALLGETASGKAFAGSLRARAELILGDRSTAVGLAEDVIAAGTAAPHYAELEAYWLRADLEDRPAGARAADYVQVGNRLTWRGRRRDLGESLKVFEQAIELDPAHLDAYWGLAEARRLLAGRAAEKSATPVSIDALRTAFADWDRGRAFGPPDTAWPWLVRAQLCGDMALAEPARNVAWQLEALRCAAACTIRFPDWSAGWAMLARSFNDLRIWPGAGWAARRCQELTGPWSTENAFEANAIFTVLLSLDPHEFARRLPEIKAAAPWGEEMATIYGAACAVIIGSGSGRERTERPVATGTQDDWWTLWTLRAQLLADEISTSAARTQLSGIERRVGAQPLLILERALVHLLLGDLDDAQRLWALAWALRDEINADPTDLAGLDLQLHLMVPDRSPLGPGLASTTVTGALLLRAELLWVRERLDDPGPVDEALAQVDDAMAAAGDLSMSGPDAVLAALDERVAAQTDPDRIQALTLARALAAGTLKVQLAEAPDLAPPVRLVLGADLVPLDAGERWQDWSLFTRTIPDIKRHVQRDLGIPVPGVRVVASEDEARDGYAVQINGVRVLAGTVPDSPPPRPVDAYAGRDLWAQPARAVEEATASDPVAIFPPSAMDDLIEQWTALGPPAEELAKRVGETPALRIGLWRHLRAQLARDGQIPSWEGGLRDVVTHAVESLS